MPVHLALSVHFHSVHPLPFTHPTPSLLASVGIPLPCLFWLWQQVVVRKCWDNKRKSLVKAGHQVGLDGLHSQRGEVSVVPNSPAPAVIWGGNSVVMPPMSEIWAAMARMKRENSS